MTAQHVTGHVEIRKLAGGDRFYVKLRLPDGTQPRRPLGKVWSRRSQPPPGYLTRRQAEARLAAILSGDDPLVNIEPAGARDTVTFKQATEEWLRYLEHDRGRKHSTLVDYRSNVRAHLLSYFGEGVDVETIDTTTVEEFKDTLLARGLAHRTVRKVLLALNGVLERAKRRGWIDANPCAAAEKVSVRHSKEYNVLSGEEVHAVVRAAPTEQIGHIIIIAAFSGLRMGEVRALRWRDVDFTASVIHVRRSYVQHLEGTPKSHEVRSVPMSDQVARVLDEVSRESEFTELGDRVFPDPLGQPLSDYMIRDKGLFPALAAAGIDRTDRVRFPARKGFVFHDLRHTFGTLCASEGIELVKIKDWMGHADIQTTMIYVHAVPRHDDAARLTAAFEPELGTGFGLELPTTERN
jgi:integrase